MMNIEKVLSLVGDAASSSEPNWRAALRKLARLYWRKQNGLSLRDDPDKAARGRPCKNPSERELAEVDFIEIFAGLGPDGVAELFYDAYPARSSAATQLGNIMKFARVPELITAINWTDVDVEHLSRLHKDAKNGVQTVRQDNGLPAKLRGKSWQQFVDYEKQLRASDSRATEQHLVAAFHAILGPRRNVDLGLMRFVQPGDPTEERCNYVILGEPVVLLFRAFKTRRYATEDLTIELTNESPYARVSPSPEDIGELGRILMESHAKNPRTEVFTRGVPTVYRLVEKASKHAFGEAIGIDLYRRLHADWVFAQNFNVNELKLANKFVDHDIVQGLTYRTQAGLPGTQAGLPVTYIEGPPNRTALETQLITVLRGIADLLEQRDPKAALEILRSTLQDIGE